MILINFVECNINYYICFSEPWMQAISCWERLPKGIDLLFFMNYVTSGGTKWGGTWNWKENNVFLLWLKIRKLKEKIPVGQTELGTSTHKPSKSLGLWVFSVDNSNDKLLFLFTSILRFYQILLEGIVLSLLYYGD